MVVAEFPLCGFDSYDCSEKTAHVWGRAGEMLQVLLNFFFATALTPSRRALSPGAGCLWYICVGLGALLELTGALGWAVITSLLKAELRAALMLSWAVNPITGHF